MKKFLALALLVAMLTSLSLAHAEDLGVQMVGPSNTAGSTDDMKLGSSYTLDDYATIKPLDFLIVDYFAQFGKKEDYSFKRRYDGNIWQVYSHSNLDNSYQDWRFVDAEWKDSGTNAQFYWLTMDVTNLQKKAVNFAEEASVKMVYQDDYEFVGWVRQIDPDVLNKQYTDYGVSRLGGDKNDYPNVIVLNPEKTHPIDMMYTGHYVFGCTIPNFVVEDKKSPLRLEIKLGGNELTYYIIK